MQGGGRQQGWHGTAADMCHVVPTAPGRKRKRQGRVVTWVTSRHTAFVLYNKRSGHADHLSKARLTPSGWRKIPLMLRTYGFQGGGGGGDLHIAEMWVRGVP